MSIAVDVDEFTQLSSPICPGLGSTSLTGGVIDLDGVLSGGNDAVIRLFLLGCFIDEAGVLTEPSSMARALYVLEQGPEPS